MTPLAEQAARLPAGASNPGCNAGMSFTALGTDGALLSGQGGVMRLDGDARLWWKPHQGSESQHAYDDGASRGAFGGASTALQAHVLSHLRQGTPLENGARDYLANLHVQAAAYHSHASGRRVPMAAFDPQTP